MNILAFTKYEDKGASSRIRLLQYIPYLEQGDIDITISPLLSNDYLAKLYSGNRSRNFDVIFSFFRRFTQLMSIGDYDLIWLQGELFPYFPSIFESILKRMNIPYVVDYDDAIFHNYENHKRLFVRLLFKKKIDKIMEASALVTVGNRYLGERAILAGAKWVEFLPSVVSGDKYEIARRLVRKERREVFSIVWIGTPMTVKFLLLIEDALMILAETENIRLINIGGGIVKLKNVEVVNKSWSLDTEIENICEGDVGIMPLNNSDWEKGKCGFKIIQYMACGLPVVATPIGANREIINNHKTGYFASTVDEWVVALVKLINNVALREKMGKVGRRKFEKEYSLEIWHERLSYLLKRAGQSTS